MKWYCGRCKTDVNYSDFKSWCVAEKGQACPWWYVPTTLTEKLRCFFGICRYKGTCRVCDGKHT